jgi:hypothetical protein
MSRLAVFVLLFHGVCASPAALYSVKLVKSVPGLCSSPPQMEFLSSAEGWKVTEKPHHNHENDWEILFELEHDAPKPPLPELAFYAPCARPARVIVGKTDVPFTSQDGRVRFQLVDDSRGAQLIEVVWRNPRGGWPIHFRHNWPMRRAGHYAQGLYPARALDAIHNYLLAAHEVFRIMPGMGPGPEQGFEGELVLMGTEVGATRGHLDYPPHVHIMHYQYATNRAGTREFISRLVPHLYLDDEGRFVRNSFTVIAGRGESAELGPEEPCRFEDAAGRSIVELVIVSGGLEIRRPGKAVYSLRPDRDEGAARVVWGYCGEEPVCRVAARDDPERGYFEFDVQRFENGNVSERYRDGYRYDPFTGKMLSKLDW